MHVAKIRKNGNGKQAAFHVGIPISIGKRLEEKEITAFEFVPTEEGILLKPIKGEPVIEEENLPEWLS